MFEEWRRSGSEQLMQILISTLGILRDYIQFLAFLKNRQKIFLKKVYFNSLEQTDIENSVQSGIK
jgi:hypothetical protein